MSQKRHELDSRVLTVFFMVALPFVAFGSFLVVNLAKGRLEESLGESLEQRAAQTKLSLERYVGEQIVALHVLALDTEVQKAVGAAPKDPAAAVASPLAARLREIVQVRPALRLLQVVDAEGRVVAASQRGGRLLQNEAPWFKTLLGEEQSLRPFVGDVQKAAGSGSPAVLEIAYPVRGVSGPATGAVRALLDAADIYGVLSSVRIGRTGHAVLIRGDDGLVIASDDADHALRTRFPGFASIQAARREKRGYWVVQEIPGRTEGGQALPSEPARLVGYAPVEQVPDVNWLVTVEQDVGEAMAPLTGVTRYLWINFALVVGAILLLALYFSFQLETPVIEEELHLHEEHVPAGARTP
jgi:hypothetical protein